jgi:hypothetical protein
MSQHRDARILLVADEFSYNAGLPYPNAWLVMVKEGDGWRVKKDRLGPNADKLMSKEEARAYAEDVYFSTLPVVTP